MTSVGRDRQRRLALDLEHQAWIRYDSAFLANRAIQANPRATAHERAHAHAVATEWLGVWESCFAECDRLGACHGR